MSVQPMTRAEDERLLHILELSDAGWTSRQISDHYGLKPEGVRTMVNRVRKAMRENT